MSVDVRASAGSFALLRMTEFDVMLKAEPSRVLRLTSMLSFRKSAVVFAICLAAVLSVSAQSGLAAALQPASSSTNSNNNVTDPLGRTTPSNTVLGFLKAAQAGDYAIASQYLQMTAARRQLEGEQLAT